MKPARALVVIALSACGVALACSTPAPDARFVETVPDRATFPPVAELLVHRCGTLDCHGSTARNMRLYGSLGLRLAPGDRPVSKGQTTDAEYDEDFASVVGLEPEVMSAVVKDQGQNPERLTFVRKARGVESHTGGALILPGDSQDKCVLSWLAGNVDMDACVKALSTP